MGVNLEGLQTLLDDVNGRGLTPDAIRGVYPDGVGGYSAFGVPIHLDASGSWVITGQGTK